MESIYRKLEVTRGPLQTYLDMDFDFTEKGVVSVSMINYMKEIVEEFPEEIKGTVSSPAANNLFEVRPDPVLLNDKMAEIFHHTVVKIFWASLRAHPDLLVAISFLTSRVQKPDKDD